MYEVNVDVLSEQLREEWLHFRGFGWDDRRIADTLRISWAAITGPTGSGRRPRHVIAERRRAVAGMARAKKSNTEIAVRLGIDVRTVQRDLGVLGIPAAPPRIRQTAAARRADLKERIGQLRTVAAAARHYQVNPCTIAADLKILGLSTPQQDRRRSIGDDWAAAS